MSKTMVEIINSHASHGIEEGLYVCKAKGCTHVYGEEKYPEAIVVTAHVVNRLNAAGFGSRHDAWSEGAAWANDTDSYYEDDNPYPVTR